MSNLICPWCNHNNITSEGINHYCNHCGYEWQDKPTVFDRITASPEVLAPEFVYREETLPGWDIWCSLLLGNVGYGTKREAIAATVERLKEGEE